MRPLSALYGTNAGDVSTYAEFISAANAWNASQAGGADATLTGNMINPEVFYSTQLLDTIRDAAEEYQYFRYAKAMPIQNKADELTVRRWAPLQAHTVPLSEGVPPITDKGSVEAYTMKAYSYGRFMEFTDVVDWKVVDPVIAHYTNEYSLVAVETLDLLAKEALLTVAQIWFAGGADSPADLTIALDANGRGVFAPAIADLREIGLAFKRNKVKPIDATYHVMCSPEFTFDMLDDPYVQKYITINQNSNGLYAQDRVLFDMFGFSFHEVVTCPESCVFIESGTPKVIKVTESGGTLTYTKTSLAKSNTAAGYLKDKRTGQDASFVPAHAINELTTFEELVAAEALEATDVVLKWQHTIILGQDALVRTGMTGEDNAKMYVKPLGSAGVLDPIDQRQSIGFKINSVGFASTRPEAVVDYINVPTQLNAF